MLLIRNLVEVSLSQLDANEEKIIPVTGNSPNRRDQIIRDHCRAVAGDLCKNFTGMKRPDAVP